MKKFLLTTLMVGLLILLVACRRDEGVEATQNLIAIENQENDILAGLSPSQPIEEYATFGETITLGHRFELTFIDNVSIASPLRSPMDGDPMRTQELYDSGIEIIIIPAILTNIDDSGHFLAVSEVSLITPNDQSQGHPEFSAAMTLMRESHTAFSSTIHRSIGAGETIEGYIFLIYDGDGDYLIRLPHRTLRYDVRLPISR